MRKRSFRGAAVNIDVSDAPCRYLHYVDKPNADFQVAVSFMWQPWDQYDAVACAPIEGTMGRPAVPTTLPSAQLQAALVRAMHLMHLSDARRLFRLVHL